MPLPSMRRSRNQTQYFARLVGFEFLRTLYVGHLALLSMAALSDTQLPPQRLGMVIIHWFLKYTTRDIGHTACATTP